MFNSSIGNKTIQKKSKEIEDYIKTLKDLNNFEDIEIMRNTIKGLIGSITNDDKLYKRKLISLMERINDKERKVKGIQTLVRELKERNDYEKQNIEQEKKFHDSNKDLIQYKKIIQKSKFSTNIGDINIEQGDCTKLIVVFIPESQEFRLILGKKKADKIIDGLTLQKVFLDLNLIDVDSIKI